jgi:hypothetical protein
MSERPRTPRWVWFAVAGLAIGLLAALATGVVWIRSMVLAVSQEDVSGDLGGNHIPAPDGASSVASPFWRKGNRMVLVGVTEYPGKPKGPEYVVLARLRTWFASEAGTSAGGFDPDRLSVLHSLGGGRDPFLVQFRVPRDGPPQFSMGNRLVPLENGRVFLLDLRKAPSAFRQVKADVAKLFPPGAPRDALEALVNALLEQDQELREFWR